MSPREWTLVLSGVLTAGYATAALFFLRFWRRSRERLFAYFATAFTMLCIQRVALSFTTTTSETDNIWFYLLRLMAFLVIIAGIIDRNRAPRP